MELQESRSIVEEVIACRSEPKMGQKIINQTITSPTTDGIKHFRASSCLEKYIRSSSTCLKENFRLGIGNGQETRREKERGEERR